MFIFQLGEPACLLSSPPTHTTHTQGKLYYFPLGKGEDTITVINPDTLQTEGSLELEGEPSHELYRHVLACLFSGNHFKILILEGAIFS